MAEIKLNDFFAEEVQAFRDSGEALRTSHAYSVEVPSELMLPTVEAYQERFKKIWGIIEKLDLLVKKDAADMDALAGSLISADTTGTFTGAGSSASGIGKGQSHTGYHNRSFEEKMVTGAAVSILDDSDGAGGGSW